MDSKKSKLSQAWSSMFKAAVLYLATIILRIKGECYDELDVQTRPANWIPDYDIFSNLKPHCPEAVEVTFILYTRTNRSGEVIRVQNDDVSSTTYIAGKKSKFIIHGWHGNSNQGWVQNTKDALLSRMDVNVIIVNWEKGASGDYFTSASNSWIAGLELAHLVKKIIKKQWGTADKFHFIGFSLGAHAAGFAGERIRGLGRISGLDPALPLFAPSITPPKGRLDCSDATFVDVIHTDGGILGIMDAIGHVDFYPNGGSNQPGCLTQTPGRPHGCNHERSTLLYLESIKSSPKCHFTAALCKLHEPFILCCWRFFFDSRRFAIMGIDADMYAEKFSTTCASRTFYLTTNDQPQFCLNTFSCKLGTLLGLGK